MSAPGLVVALAAALAAATPAGDLPPDEEARAQDIMREVRCMVCAGESILDSNSPMAEDMRLFVRERVAAGRESDAIRQDLVDRFGHEVLLRPPVNVRTAPLWLAPILVLALGGAILFTAMRKRS